jgi:hypothetical protein
MIPVSPVVPGREHEEVVYAKNQPQYLPLPALPIEDGIVTRWKLSWGERLRILWTGDLYLSVLTFGQRLQPLKPTTTRPTLGA